MFRLLKIWIVIAASLMQLTVHANVLHVGKSQTFQSIRTAISVSKANDTIFVHAGIYKEGNIEIKHSLTLIGLSYPVIDGQNKYEMVSVRASRVEFNGFVLKNSGYASLDDPAAIKLYGSRNSIICNNILEDNFFGIYIQYGSHCLIKNNKITAHGVEEQRIGNGIHCWKSDSLQIISNTIQGHRDGIYFEFVTSSVIWRNFSSGNVRYGLHFMFSHQDAYYTNVFSNNGAGVAVMFTKGVMMANNVFEYNWGDAAYGILLKEISDSYIIGNKFRHNTSGIYMEGASRIQLERNTFVSNGWAMKIQASCMDNVIELNNFLSNTFDMGTNGTLVLNQFKSNYWDKYEGYDLNGDGYGDVPYHPLSLFAVISENNPSAMLLFRSFIMSLLDRSERIMPSLTPDNFKDDKPQMHQLNYD